MATKNDEKLFTGSTPPDLSSFVADQRKLLQLERDAELEQSKAVIAAAEANNMRDLERKGIVVDKLVVAGTRTGMYGRTVVDLRKARDQPLPAHKIQSGDIIGVSESGGGGGKQISSGVVTRVTQDTIVASFDESGESLELSSDGMYRTVKLANDITYRRLKAAIDRLEDPKRHTLLTNCLFGASTLSPALQSLSPKISKEDGDIQYVNENLDASQRAALKFALLQKELSVIHGPPGTGKTTTVVEVVTQSVRSGCKVLCCAPSNVAVDNLLERLVANRLKVVRLGHPARVHVELQKHSLDAIISLSDQTQLVKDARSDIDQTLAQAKRARSKGERAGLWGKLKELRKEVNERERRAIKEILIGADVVLSTLTSASLDGPLKQLPDNHFDITVIDECSQAVEMACWVALPFSRKAILAGDHLQLPPTIMSSEAAKKGLEKTLMERVIEHWGAQVVRMLTTQYRMNSKIMDWSSEALYAKRLVAHESVAGHLLKDLPGVAEDENSSEALVLIDTAGCDMYELEAGDEVSKANEGEVALTVLHVEQLIKSGLKAQDIAVITPYNLQVELLRLQLAEKYPKLEIRSVDGFQGREKEAVVLSLVRSNAKGEVGFLAESRRLNVAVTRARRHVAVICNAETVSHDKFLKSFVEYLEKNGDVRSAMQYQNEVEALQLKRPEGMELTVKDSEDMTRKKVKKDGKNTKTDVKKEKKANAKVQPKPKASNFPEGGGSTTKPSRLHHEAEVENLKDDSETRAQFEAIVTEFVESPKSSLALSTDLNSHDRLLVHEIAEKLGICHESVGQGKNRHICLKKQKTEMDQECEEREKRKPSKSDHVKCSTCQREVPRANIELHKIRCKKPESGGAELKHNREQSNSKAKVKKAKKNKKQDEDGDEDDIDKLLQSFSRLDTVCNATERKTGKGCKAKTATLGANCEHCRVRFCLGHAQPEVHGCGDEARRAARLAITRDRKLYPGSGRPPTKLDGAKKAQIQRKFDKKLGEMSDGRKAKKKGDEK